MRAKFVTFGPWHIPVCVKHALCVDGVRRYAWIGGRQPDTFFSIPAKVKVQGKSVLGYITGCETDGKQDYAFHAVTYGKNYKLLARSKDEHLV